MKVLVTQNSFFEKISYTVSRLIESVKSDGLETTAQKIVYRIRNKKLFVQKKYIEGPYHDPDSAYRAWLEKNIIKNDELQELRNQSCSIKYRPLISLVIPTYKSNLLILEKTIHSILDQAYPFWQICICDDGSNDKLLISALKNWTKDARIECIYKEHNEGIIAASQGAANFAKGEYITFIDQDDILSPDALYRVVEKLNEDPQIDLIYSDNDKIDLNDVHREVYFKPDYSPDELYCHNYIGHLCVIRKELFESIGGFHPGFDGAQDFDLLLRAIEKTDKIAHLPYILYSWRKTPGSTASSPTSKHYAYEAGKKALVHHFGRCGTHVTVEETTEKGLYRCHFPSSSNCLISIIIAATNSSTLNRCLDSLYKITNYKNFEIIIINQNKNIKIEQVYKVLNIKLVIFDPPHGLNYSQMMNQARRLVNSSYLLFLNESVEIIDSNWLEALLEPIQRKGVGAVGAKILSPNKKIYHGGIILGFRGIADYALKGVPEDAVIYNQPQHLIRNCSAVSSLCVFTKGQIFDEVGGFSEDFNGNLNEIDFCLKLRSKGYWIVWTPFCKITIHEECRDAEPNPTLMEEKFKERWKNVLSKPDPFYNICLTRKYFDFSPNIE